MSEEKTERNHYIYYQIWQNLASVSQLASELRISRTRVRQIWDRECRLRHEIGSKT